MSSTPISDTSLREALGSMVQQWRLFAAKDRAHAAELSDDLDGRVVYFIQAGALESCADEVALVLEHNLDVIAAERGMVIGCLLGLRDAIMVSSNPNKELVASLVAEAIDLLGGARVVERYEVETT